MSRTSAQIRERYSYRHCNFADHIDPHCPNNLYRGQKVHFVKDFDDDPDAETVNAKTNDFSDSDPQQVKDR
jgi:hypothetical protein